MIAVTVSEMKAAASSVVSADTSREIAVVVVETAMSVAAADPVAAIVAAAEASTLTTPADAAVVVDATTAVAAPTGITEEAPAEATHQTIADAVVAVTDRPTAEAHVTVDHPQLAVATVVPAQGTVPTTVVVAPQTAGAQLAPTASLSALATTLEVLDVREDQDREVAHPQEVPLGVAPPTPSTVVPLRPSPELLKEILRHRIVSQMAPVKHLHKTTVQLRQTAKRLQLSNQLPLTMVLPKMVELNEPANRPIE